MLFLRVVFVMTTHEMGVLFSRVAFKTAVLVGTWSGIARLPLRMISKTISHRDSVLPVLTMVVGFATALVIGIVAVILGLMTAVIL